LVGQTLGLYRLIEQIGKGAMVSVDVFQALEAR
jgi:hypothetical protein